jgi:hypothetical protein
MRFRSRLIWQLPILASLTLLTSCASNDENPVEALLRIRSKPGQTTREYEVYRRTQVALLSSPFVINGALRDPAIANLPVIKEQTDPVEWLEAQIKPIYKAKSEILKVTCPEIPRDQAAQIINAIVYSYQTEVMQGERNDKFARLEMLDSTQSEHMKTIRELNDEIHQLQVELGVASTASNELKETLKQAEVKAIHARIVSLEDKLLNAQAEQKISDATEEDDSAQEEAQKLGKAVLVYQEMIEEQQAKLAVAMDAVSDKSSFSSDLLVKKHELELLEELSTQLAREQSAIKRSLQEPSSVQLLQLAFAEQL